MESEESGKIAAPGHGGAVAGELEAGDVGNRAIGAVLAGNPFGVVEGERAGLNGDGFMSVDKFLWSLRGVEGDQNGGSLRAHETGCRKRESGEEKELGRGGGAGR